MNEMIHFGTYSTWHETHNEQNVTLWLNYVIYYPRRQQPLILNLLWTRYSILFFSEYSRRALFKLCSANCSVVEFILQLLLRIMICFVLEKKRERRLLPLLSNYYSRCKKVTWHAILYSNFFILFVFA